MLAHCGLQRAKLVLMYFRNHLPLYSVKWPHEVTTKRQMDELEEITQYKLSLLMLGHYMWTNNGNRSSPVHIQVCAGSISKQYKHNHFHMSSDYLLCVLFNLQIQWFLSSSKLLLNKLESADQDVFLFCQLQSLNCSWYVHPLISF